MVAKVISGKNIRGVLNYNENKVKEGKAKCILASRYGVGASGLSFADKLNRFTKLIVKNQKVKTNALHISLNFDPSEKLSNDSLSKIAISYMDKIGFSTQPYLVYQHFDAGHPHIHIVTTNVQSTGKRIDIHNIGRNESEKARREIEKNFGLIKADSKRKTQELINPISLTSALYGKSETKRSISNVVTSVTRTYKYTSLPELNAVLGQFNVIADRGKEGTLLYGKRGLQYSLLDKHGDKIGIPIKASSIYGKPTLNFLEKRFKLNEALRTPHKARLKNIISKYLNPPSPQWERGLGGEGIFVLFRQNPEGRIYGVTFVDNKNKVVFNGSALGKAYTAKAITDRLSKGEVKKILEFNRHINSLSDHHINPLSHQLGVEKLVVDLTTAEQTDFTSPNTAIKRKRKKKRKRRSL